MNVQEYQAADLLAERGIPVNQGKVATTPEEAERIAAEFAGTVAIKAQVHTGGRGKAGGIKLAKTPGEAHEAASQILGMDIRGHVVHKVLVVPGVDIDREFYLGVVLDRPNRVPVLMASAEGGVDIETVAAETPEKIIKAGADPFLGLRDYQTREVGFALGLEKELIGPFATIAS